MPEILEIEDTSLEIIDSAGGFSMLEQGVRGPQGPAGPAGPPGDPDGFLQASMRLSELNTEEARAAARENLGLSVIDGGTFN